MDATKSQELVIGCAESYGAIAKHEHIVKAIQSALQQAKLRSASSILLFLTNGYTQDLKNALKLAAKTAGTVQVYGATAAGFLTHNHWVMDHEGAAVMVFSEGCDLQPVNLLAAQNTLNDSLPLLCLSSPEHSKLAINHAQWGQYAMFGAITSNAYGVDEYPIWQGARITKNGFLHANFNTNETINLKAHTIVSQGIRRISGNLTINQSKANCISEVNNQSPTDSLKSAIPENMYPIFLEQPYHTLCAVSEATSATDTETDTDIHKDPTQDNSNDKPNHSAANALNKDFYRLFNIVGFDEKQQSVYLSDKIKQGQQCFWALRDNAIAEQEWNNSLKKLSESIEKPAFAILFCSESRGPYFHGENDDTDLALFKRYFPNTPLIGIYSSGEISAGAHYQSLLRRYSSVLTVYSI